MAPLRDSQRGVLERMGRFTAEPTDRSWAWRALLLAAAAWFALACPPASADVLAPPSGKVYWGGQGGYGAGNISDFERQSGKHPAVYQFFVRWGATEFIARCLEAARARRTRAMVHLELKGTGLTPRAIAHGEGDSFLVALTERMADFGLPVYLRPLAEMNNGNNPYSAYDLGGQSRGPAYTTDAHRSMWRRIALIVRGGDVDAIDRDLRRLDLPPVRTGRARLGSPEVSLVWTPLSFGNPEIEKNHPKYFWPGSAYVDWAGTTWYSRHRTASAFDRFYDYPAWRHKPFVFAEFSVWGPESPGFVDQVFDFVNAHPRVQMVIYYQSALLEPEFRLSTHPRSRATLRRRVNPALFVGQVPEFEPDPGEPVQPPTQGETANVFPTGRVEVRLPGSRRAVRLRRPRQLPVGTTVDATRGQITLATAVDADGSDTQSAVVSAGRFVIRQSRGEAVTTLALQGRIGPCASTASSSSARRKRKRRRLRVRTRGPGEFTTNGKYGSGSTRGTRWLTEDRCDGTLFRVAQGVVEVRDFARNTTVTVTAGGQYVARPPAPE
jgi:hypothetical protein